MLAITNKARLLAIYVLIAATQILCANGATPIDLKPYCNFSLTNSLIGTGSLNGPNNLASLPSGTNAFATVPFVVSGIIQLAGNQAVLAGRKFPDKIGDIKVASKCARIHILHGTGWNEVENTTIATLVIHYQGGTKSEIPIVYGKHVWDWWDNEEKEDHPVDANTKVAWTGVNRISKMFGTNLKVYKTTFPNPKPDALVEQVDYVSAKKESAPFLLGLTVE